MQKLKKLFYSVLTCTFLINVNLPANSTEKEVKVYSGRHYNTDRSVYKKFAEETGIKVRLIEAAGISLIERLKREKLFAGAEFQIVTTAMRYCPESVPKDVTKKVNKILKENKK